MRSVLSTVIMIVFLLAGKMATAQVSINVNIDKQPVWGPTGYDHVDYYYLPEQDVYYCVSKRQYVYQEKNRWVFAASLPARYPKVDLYKTYKVVINEDKPYMHHDEHVKKYMEFRNRHDQEVIRDSHDKKYFVNKNHPQHGEWEREHRH
jgi:hypothetical protein